VITEGRKRRGEGEGEERISCLLKNGRDRKAARAGVQRGADREGKEGRDEGDHHRLGRDEGKSRGKKE